MRASFFGLALALAALVGCEGSMMAPGVVGSGVVKSEKRGVPNFSGVRVDGGYKVDITVGEATEVTVEGDDNVLPLIHTTVERDSLVIRSDQSYRTNNSVKVTIKTPQLSAVAVNGSGDIAARGVRADAFKLAINGSGSMTATGTAQEFDAAINGSGDLKLAELAVDKANIAIAGSGKALIDAAKELNVTISGSGDVRYRDHPGIQKHANITGSGSVKPM